MCDDSTSREEQLESLDEFLSMAKVRMPGPASLTLHKGSSVKDSCEELLRAWATHRPVKAAQPQGSVMSSTVLSLMSMIRAREAERRYR